MPKVSKDTATQGGEYGPVTDRSDELEGYTVGFTTFHVDMDQTPMLKGLPNDECQCPHWGYVLEGRITFRYDDNEETYDAGDAFYAPAGHVPVADAGTEYVQFSPSEELRQTSEAIQKNMQQMQRSAP